LGAPHELPVPVHNGTQRPPQKAYLMLRRFHDAATHGSIDPQPVEALQQAVADQAVSRGDRRGHPIGSARDNRVSEISQVQHRPPAAGPPDDLNTQAPAGCQVQVMALLTETQGHGGRAPLIEAQGRRRFAVGMQPQDSLIDGHVERAGHWPGIQKTPSVHRIFPKKTGAL